MLKKISNTIKNKKAMTMTIVYIIIALMILIVLIVLISGWYQDADGILGGLFS